MRGREGGQRLGSRGCDCWQPENWCPATRRGDRPGTLPALSVLCSVCSVHFFCSQLLLLTWIVNVSYPYLPISLSLRKNRIISLSRLSGWIGMTWNQLGIDLDWSLTVLAAVLLWCLSFIITFKLNFAPRCEADPLLVWLWCRIYSHSICSPHVCFALWPTWFLLVGPFYLFSCVHPDNQPAVLLLADRGSKGLSLVIKTSNLQLLFWSGEKYLKDSISSLLPKVCLVSSSNRQLRIWNKQHI